MTNPDLDLRLCVMTGDQERFLTTLNEFDSYLVRRKLKGSVRVLSVLEQMARGQRDDDVKSEMLTIIEAQRTRLVRLNREKQRERINATARASKRKPNAVCVLCGEPYRRGKKEPARRACHICRPLNGSKSVRTVGGGLPTLGKRRR